MRKPRYVWIAGIGLGIALVVSAAWAGETRLRALAEQLVHAMHGPQETTEATIAEAMTVMLNAHDETLAMLADQRAQNAEIFEPGSPEASMMESAWDDMMKMCQVSTEDIMAALNAFNPGNLAALYAGTFTEAEMQAAIAFYSSPEGRSFNLKLAEISACIDQQLTEKLIEDLMKIPELTPPEVPVE